MALAPLILDTGNLASQKPAISAQRTQLGCSASICASYHLSSTIFVSNLSYNTTQESLQAAFDDIAPVKTAFVVYEKAPTISPSDDPANAPTKGPSKGVGYVTFAIKEDAEAAITRFGEDASQPLLIDGRAIRVKWADRKVRLDDC